MKKKIIILFLSIPLILTFSACQQTKIPEGIDNKAFYIDMVKCLDLTKKALETKNTKYVSDIGDLLLKNTEKDYFKIIIGDMELSEVAKNNYGLNKKEQYILINITSVSMDLSSYLQNYYNNNYNTNILIDTSNIEGQILLKDIQKTISVMEIKYDFGNK
jgi:sporulation protein YlmC with PRC-barrel domain